MSDTLLPLPDSRLSKVMTAKNVVVWPNGMKWVPIYCANCGADGGLVPEENCTFAFYLCQRCFEAHGHIEGTYAEPDAIFWEKVRSAQIEKFGRELTCEEQIEALKDSDHILAKLARERSKLIAA